MTRPTPNVASIPEPPAPTLGDFSSSDPDASVRARFRGASAVVLLPTLNEEEGLARTLGKLPLDRFGEQDQRIQPLVIDGGSTDRTLEIAREWDIPVLRQTGRGKGGAVLEAVAWIRRMGIPFVVVLDADATYPPDRILPALHLLRSGADLVVGVRRPVWGPPSDLKDLVHRMGNIVLSYAASFLTGRPILDLCSGFWGVSTHRFMDLDLDDSGFAIEAELVLKSVHRGLNIHQIPVDYHERVGRAKLRAFRDGSRIMTTILREGRAPPHHPVTPPIPARWSRDILSIGLALGMTGAVLECVPSRATEAHRIAHYLLPTLPGMQVRPGIDLPPSPASANAPARPPVPAGAGPEGALPPLTVQFPPSDVGSGRKGPALVSFRSQQRQVTIELPPEQGSLGSGGATSPWSRAGAWQISGTKPWAMSPSLLILTSRVNLRRDYHQAALLSANGYRLIETPALEVGPIPRAALEGLSSKS
jgi:Glycosyl transferase family 2